MAHGDYNCCAVCDRKLDYIGWDAKTKEDICSDCLKSFRDVEIPALDVGELINWVNETEPAQVLAKLAICGFSKCFYDNPVDKAVFGLQPPPNEGEGDD